MVIYRRRLLRSYMKAVSLQLHDSLSQLYYCYCSTVLQRISYTLNQESKTVLVASNSSVASSKARPFVLLSLKPLYWPKGVGRAIRPAPVDVRRKPGNSNPAPHDVWAQRRQQSPCLYRYKHPTAERHDKDVMSCLMIWPMPCTWVGMAGGEGV